MDEKTFSALSAALEELNDFKALEELNTIKERVDSGNYFVAFIGQYSAGKSSLINNLLGRQILPGGRIETTPILTYISYGEQEGGRLFYLDGETEDIDLETVMNITQSSKGEHKLEEIEHMEIFLNVPMLADGMILLDTPGINTLITRHEQLLANSMSLASAIIYVTSGAPSRVDIEKLQDFAAHGFPLSFVRTHCDEINDWEENYQQVVTSDKNVLSNCDLLNKLEECFFVSNVEGSEYFGELEKIRMLLKSKGGDVKSELNKAAGARLEIIANRAISELKEFQKTLGQQKSERDTTIVSQRKKIDEEITRLREVLEKRRQRLNNEVENCCNELKKNLKQYAQTSGEKAAKIIEAAGDDVKTNSDMENYVRQNVRPILKHAFESVNLQISPIIQNINGELKASGEINITGADAVIEDLPELQSYSDVIDYQNSEIEEIRQNILTLQKNREELQMQLSTANDSELQNELVELENELIALQNERTGLGVYKPKMIQVDAGNNSGAKIGKTIGNILDLATLFIPAGAAAKVATKVGFWQKIAKLPTQAAKMVKGLFYGQKVTKTYATAARIAKAKDFMLKGAEAVNKAKEVAPASFLDYLTLEHWGEKLGSQFDSPPVYEEDENYRKEYFSNKRQIEQDILKKQQEIYRRKENLGAFKNEEERRKAQLESLEVDEKELNRRLKNQEAKMRKDAAEKTRKQWKNQWAEYYRENLSKFLIVQTNQYLEDLPERLEQYQATRFSSLEEKLAEKKSEYNSLSNMHEDDVAQKLQRITNILKQLESAGYR